MSLHYVCLQRSADCLHMVQLMPLHPKTPSPLASFKSRLVLPFWYRLIKVVLEKRPLNGCSNSSSSCSIDNERLHRCCHLPNDSDSRRILPLLHSQPGDIPKNCPVPWGRSWLLHNTLFLGPPNSMHIQNGISVGSAILLQLTAVINR